MVYTPLVSQSQQRLGSPQKEVLEALAGGGIVALVHTRGGTIASLFPREGRHRNISYKAVQPLLDAGWIEDVVPPGLRWRGSKFVISAKGLRALGVSPDARPSVPELAASEVGMR